MADLLNPGVADVSVGDVVVDGEAKEEDILKRTEEARKDEIDPTHRRRRSNCSTMVF